MHRHIEVSPDIAVLVGNDNVTQWREGPWPAAYDCPVCGQRGQVDDGTPTSTVVRVVADAPGSYAVTWAHSACTPSAVLPGTARLVEMLEATVWLGTPPVVFWCAGGAAQVLIDGADYVDMVAAMLLEDGGRLVTRLDADSRDLDDVPRLDGWTASIDAAGTTLYLAGTTGIAYDGPLGGIPQPSWARAALAAGVLTLVAIPGAGTDPIARAEQLARAGRLVAGTVPLIPRDEQVPPL